METPKDAKVTAAEAHDKAFKAAKQGGYDTVDVDTFLDRVVATLQSYENSFRRHREIEQNFTTIREKADQQQLLINKLQSELKSMYDNGYANQAMMKRIQGLEERMAGGTPGVEDRLKRIENALEQVLNGLSRLAGMVR